MTVGRMNTMQAMAAATKTAATAMDRLDEIGSIILWLVDRPSGWRCRACS